MAFVGMAESPERVQPLMTTAVVVVAEEAAALEAPFPSATLKIIEGFV